MNEVLIWHGKTQNGVSFYLAQSTVEPMNSDVTNTTISSRRVRKSIRLILRSENAFVSSVDQTRSTKSHEIARKEFKCYLV